VVAEDFEGIAGREVNELLGKLKGIDGSRVFEMRSESFEKF
jgi:hypothetical protein